VFESFESYIKSLEIPEVCLLNKRLFKKDFYMLAKLGRVAQEQFSKAVQSITWTHTLKKETINIPPFVTEELEYIEVAYIHVALQDKKHYKKVAEVIHAIPYPVVLWMTHGNTLLLSTASKRINQSDKSKLTIEEYLYSGWIGLPEASSEAMAFLESLQTKKLSFENFYKFYADIGKCIVAYEATGLGVEFSTADTSQKKPILDKINKLKEQMVSLRNAIKKESQFNAKVRLNMQVKELTRQIEELKIKL